MASRTAFSPDDERRILAALPRYSLRNATLMVFGLHTGFRATELSRLTLGHVFYAAGIRDAVTLERASLKGGRGVHRRSVRARVVPLSPRLKQMLRDYICDRFDCGRVDFSAPLFPGSRGQGLSRWQINRVVQEIVADAGCGNGRFGTHSLRKTFADRVYRASGHDINLTRQALGHQSVVTTMRYLSLDADSVHAAILAATACSAPAAVPEPLVFPSQHAVA